MAVSLTVNGVVYSYPSVNDIGWGPQATAWATAVSQSTLQKTGGSFTLTTDVDFGANFGLKSLYYKTRATNPATAGNFRLGNAETVVWRNAGNTADQALSVNSSNQLTFAGAVIATALGAIPAASIAAGTVSDTEFGYLDGVTSAIQTQITAKQDGDSDLTALAGLSTTGVIVRTGSGTATTRTITGPAAGISVTNGSGVSGDPTFALTNDLAAVEALSTTGLAKRTATDTWSTTSVRSEIGTTTKGDIIADTGSALTRVAVGADGTVLTSDAASSGGVKWNTALSNPMTAVGDLIVGGTSGSATRLPTSLLGDIAAEAANATVTMTIATPGVVTLSAHGLVTGDKIYLTTSGALPTGLAASTTYFVIFVSSSTFNLATSMSNALAGTKITTSGSQSGTHTMFYKGLIQNPETNRGAVMGNVIGSGYIGQVYSTSFTGGNLVSTTVGRSAIITLPSAGIWMIYATSAFTGTATSCTKTNSSIGTSDSLNFTLAATNSFQAAYDSFSPATVVDRGCPWSPIIVNSSTVPVVYIWSQATFSGGTLNNYGFVTAVRIA